MITKYFFDTEFLDRGPNDLHLISLGVVSEDGTREYYAEVTNAGFLATETSWLTYNVAPHLDHQNVRTLYEIGQDLLDFTKGTNPRFWGYFADWDWVLVCHLYGGMLSCPLGHRANDIAQEAERLNVRFQTSSPRHKAIDCARWTRDRYLQLQKVERAKQEGLLR